MLPKARKKDLIVQNLDDETLIYDLRSDRAHCLNRSASLVWRYCDGKTDVNRIAKKLSAISGESAPASIVELALQRLQKAQLLERTTVAKGSPRITRREVIQGLGKAVVIALPVVTSILAPEAIQAASCIISTACVVGRIANNKRCCCTNGKTKTMCDSTKGLCTTSATCS